ncbi:MAG: ABC transporter permease [Candidatus Latescibacterota bacterium]
MSVLLHGTRRYLVGAARSLLRRKLYATVNVAGLAVAMGTCLLLLFQILHALRYDDFHRNADRIYRIALEVNRGPDVLDDARCPASLGPALGESWPEVQQVMRVAPWRSDQRTSALVASRGDRRFYEEGILGVDPEFLTFFDFPLAAGDARTALLRPHSIVLTQQMARRYFGSGDAVGESLTLVDGDYEVTGVLSVPPGASHLRFDALVPFRLGSAANDDQHRVWVYTYVLLAPGANPASLETRWDSLLQGYRGAQIHRERSATAFHYRPHFQPLRDIHLHSHLAHELAPNQDPNTITLLAVVAALVMTMACLNYANLTAAQATAQAREIALRKIMGAGRLQLAAQLMAATVILATVALLTALLLVTALLPHCQAFTGHTCHVPAAGAGLVPALFLFALLAGLLAAIYPTLLVMSFPPVHAVAVRAAQPNTGRLVGRLLVCVQSAIAMALVAVALGLLSQVRYVDARDLGFARDGVVVLSQRVATTGAIWAADFASFRAELLRSPAIEAVSACSRAPGLWTGLTAETLQVTPLDGVAGPPLAMPVVYIDDNFLGVLHIRLLAGRNVRAPGPAAGNDLLLNQTAARMLGWSDPVGQHLAVEGSLFSAPIQGQVVGWVEDFHVRPFSEPVPPVILRPHLSASTGGRSRLPAGTRGLVLVRTSPGATRQAVEHMTEVWRRTVPSYPFEYHLLKEDIDSAYRPLRQQTRLLCAAAGVAIVLACFGLFGLASFTAQRRTREIGIRKALGGSSIGILLLLTREYATLATVASLIALPAAYAALRHYLNDFAYRIELGPGIFLAAIGLTVGVAWLTVSCHALRASLTTPTDALRHE